MQVKREPAACGSPWGIERHIVKPLSYQSVLDNPDLFDSLHREARRERAEAVHRLLIAPFRALFMRPRPRRSPRAATARCVGNRSTSPTGG